MDELDLAQRNGDRGAELVRRVLDEPPLALEQAQVRVGDLLDLTRRGKAAPSVPGHREEHRRHERHLGDLIERLEAARDVDPDGHSGRHHHRSQGPHRGPDVPHPEPIQKGQAHPDEVERHRLPIGQQEHGDQVEDGKGDPGGVDPMTAEARLGPLRLHRRGTPRPEP